jgi:hypothetical protein
VVSGDVVAERLAAAGVAGPVLPWRDVLHEGPLPGGGDAALRAARAAWLAGCGWGEREELEAEMARRDALLASASAEAVLWFEHDLYDQLQLVQVLATRPERLPSSWVQAAPRAYVADLDAPTLRDLAARRRPVPAAAFALARRAWDALRRPEPAALLELLAGDTSVLPDLAAALRRLLEELPDARSGLSRSERQTLEAAPEASTLRELHRAAHHDREPAVFLGDTVFAAVVERLSAVVEPLLVAAGGAALQAPRAGGDEEAAFWAASPRRTAAGDRALAGDLDHLERNGGERWVAGMRIVRGFAWRWNPASGTVVPSA